MKNSRVKIEVLPDREFGIERERLRHVADAVARTHVAGVERFSEQQRLAGGRRQQARQHLHGRGLAAAVRAEKAEDLAAFDGEIHPVDRGEIAETAGQIAGGDDGIAVENSARRYLQCVVTAALLFRKQRNEGILDRRGAGAGLDFGRGSGCQDLARIHRHQPIEPLGFLHIGGRHDHAHAGTARTDAVDQFPELAARERIDAGGRLIQNEQIRIVNERAAQAEFLAHAARQLLRRPIFEGSQPGAVQQFRDSPFAFVAGLSEQAAEKLDVLADAQVGIEILPKPLRHVGDPRTYRRPVLRVGDVAAEHRGAAGLVLTRARDDAEKRRLSHPVRTDQSDHAIGRYRDRYVDPAP